ncbi:GNAT family N-acetyltransferase [Aquibacillus sp. 3ASR75-11]|uniref:GNAT family N-acetyltransferase n=1 Tax=Terrihalobacillus insolitus TaxID=2950438 RepID=A0A9X3WTS3_9BACI|nr:GNAT family N-acetyltransferase [Terrihalobacillus insolitus]MDC3414326.1 GNAT family N-acetyltransferase [Terrihalobacillus insolitus]MDC3425802.1 GNAT family N-acetyltransferase [Terrihalobacillus insolitus]
MIRVLTETDREQCLAFVKEKPAENLFIIGDIEAFGFDEDFQDLWGDFDEAGDLKAVLLRYRENYIIYSPGDFNASGIGEIIAKDSRTHKFLSGISSIVNKVVVHLSQKPRKTREFYYAKCEKMQDLQIPDINIKQAGIHDIPRIIELQKQIPEFETRDGQEESLKKNMEEGISRTYYVEDGEKIISTAMTTAENSMSAMVVGVCTHSEYEKKGYASACMTHLCGELLKEGKDLCLFYDNPKAGNIYKRLGFVDIGKWVMHVF